VPRLTKQQATAVAKSDAWGSFAPVSPGIYAAQLTKVEVREGTEAPYWSWEYQLLDAERNIRAWDNTSLSDKAYGKLKAVFEAYGVDTGTDTDELVGSVMALRLGQRTIQGGNRKGELTNSIEEVMPIDAHPDAGTVDFEDLATGGNGGRIKSKTPRREPEQDPF
jgi:hypothetical protein